MLDVTPCKGRRWLTVDRFQRFRVTMSVMVFLWSPPRIINSYTGCEKIINIYGTGQPDVAQKPNDYCLRWCILQKRELRCGIFAMRRCAAVNCTLNSRFEMPEMWFVIVDMSEIDNETWNAPDATRLWGKSTKLRMIRIPDTCNCNTTKLRDKMQITVLYLHLDEYNHLLVFCQYGPYWQNTNRWLY